MIVPDKKLIYSVFLAFAKTPSAVPGGATVMVGASQTAFIEYSGVVEVAPESQHLAAAEGGKVNISVEYYNPLCFYIVFVVTCCLPTALTLSLPRTR